MLESALRCAGYRTGCTPRRICCATTSACASRRWKSRTRSWSLRLSASSARAASISLTYFEFGTLAAVLLFIEARDRRRGAGSGPGRAAGCRQCFRADCAILTSVDLDHTDIWAHTRSRSVCEKAGIFRPGKPAVVAEPQPPAGMLERAHSIGADVYLIDRDFGYAGENTQWQFWDWLGKRSGLPLPALRGNYQLSNAAAALAALDALRERLPVEMGAIRRGLVNLRCPVDSKCCPAGPRHPRRRPQSSGGGAASGKFAATRPPRPPLAVFAMLKDKDIEGVIDATKREVDEWAIAPLPGPRGADCARLRKAFQTTGIQTPVHEYQDVGSALKQARERARADDNIIVFGSFYTVAEALSTLAD